MKNNMDNLYQPLFNVINSSEYGCNIFEYFDNKGITDFDVCSSSSAFHFVEIFLNSVRKTPKNYLFSDPPSTLLQYSKVENEHEIKSIWEAKTNKDPRYLLNFCDWNYELFCIYRKLNYIPIGIGALTDYSIYKAVILSYCVKYLEIKRCKILMTRVPQANQIRNRSKLEKFLANNSVYGYSSEILKYGIHKEEVFEDIEASFIFQNGIQKNVDKRSKYCNVINGFRLTTNIPENVTNHIWIFGPSVVYGFFTDDTHTIASSLQREICSDKSLTTKYAVVNCSNYNGNDVWNIASLLNELPVKEDDICIFHLLFPKIILENNARIIDLSAYFERPHNYGEIFIDINHMTGKGYCIQGKILFHLLKERGYFSQKKEKNFHSRREINSKLSNDEKGELQKYLSQLSPYRPNIGAIVMNCNPFTLGHRYLVEYAASKVDTLFLFIVEEDKSYFSFQERFEMVKQGTSDIKNVMVIPSGNYIVSQRTFPAYSNKENIQEESIDASLDVELFGKYIAPYLGIKKRFLGEEPFDHITKQYNEIISMVLPNYGIEVEIVPRKKVDNEIISASHVRELLRKGKLEETKKFLPISTFTYLFEKCL